MAAALDSEPGATDLRVGDIAISAYRHVFGNLNAFVRASAFPFGLYAALVFVFYNTPLHDVPLIDFALYLPQTFFAFTWHRYLLLGPAVSPIPWIRSPHRQHIPFLVYAAIIIFLTMSPWMFAGRIYTGLVKLTEHLSGSNVILMVFEAVSSFFVTILICVALYYIIARLCFIFPATAVGHRYSLRASWRDTRDQAGRVFGLIMLTYVPLFVLYGAIYYAVILLLAESLPSLLAVDTTSNLTFSGLDIIMAPIDFLSVALLVSGVSFSFKTITGWGPPSDVQ